MTEISPQNILQRYSSEILWHFVGRKDRDNPQKCYDILLAILRDGNLKLSSTSEPFTYHKHCGGKEELYGYPVCCLADIPLKDLLLHSMRYGEFAIGFHRDSAIRNNFIPVLYVPQKSGIIDYFLKLRGELELFVQGISPDMADKFKEFLSMLGSVTKPCNLQEDVDDNPELDELQMNNFYYEREWRSIYNWKFKPEDVAMIIVHNSQMIEQLHEQIDHSNLVVQKTVPILSFDMICKI